MFLIKFEEYFEKMYPCSRALTMMSQATYERATVQAYEGASVQN